MEQRAPMMLRIGSNFKGFTLIEVMVTTTILALGVVLIYESFFISLDSFNYCSNYLNVAPWMDEKIWQAKDDLNRSGNLDEIETQGEFQNKGKNFTWNLSSSLIDKVQSLCLYEIDLSVFWKEGKRQIKLSRNTYALYKKE